MKKSLLVLALLSPVCTSAAPQNLLENLTQEIIRQLENARTPSSPVATQASIFQACSQFFVGGLAPRVPDLARMSPRELCYDAFAVLHSGRSKTPLFVAQRLNRKLLHDAKGEKRTDRFFADSRLPASERAELEDYKGSGYARGHMAPAADMPDPRAMAQSFSLANMVPQAPVNNQRAWAGIERATRKYVMRASGNVYVITGPVFSDAGTRIGPGRVWVPSHLYKLVHDEASGRNWAHWIENTDGARAGQPISYQELVRRTGIDFLPALAAGR